MPETNVNLTPIGGHAPVSNKPEELEVDFFIEKTVVKDPSLGADARTTQVNPDGTEVVPGVVGTAVAKGEVAKGELFTAPLTSQLRDIGELTFGPRPPEAESIMGPDDRVQIQTTDVYPWRASASLLITAADNSLWLGTGWFVGPHTLMTAGHCVYPKGEGGDGWVKSIDVMPGRNGNKLPYGKVTATRFHSVKGWTENGDQNYDYGAIILPTDLGTNTGWFGFGVYADADLVAMTGNITGYPADKPAGTEWYDSHKIAKVNNRKVYYEIDTYGGQSGSAVYRIAPDGGRYGVAIHAYGVGGGVTTNSGTRICTPVFNNMVAWKA